MVEPVFYWYPGFDLLTINPHKLLRCRSELEGPFIPQTITLSGNLGFSWLPLFCLIESDWRSARVGFSWVVSDWRSALTGLQRSFGDGSASASIGNERSVLRPRLREIL